MDIYNNQYLSLPQQVDKNKKDIEEIKENPKIINWTGEWTSGTVYSYGQGVEYQGSSYVFKGETDLESTVAPSSDLQHWQLLAEKGETGQNGQDGQDGQNGTNGVGISSIAKTGTSGLVDTYTITLTNGQTYTFTVTNGADGQNGQDGQDGTNGSDGVGISSIAKTETSGLVDTYTITLSNGQTSTFTVTNGADGQNGTNGVGISSIAKTGTSGLIDTYTITLTNGQTSTFTVTNGADGLAIGSIAKTGTSGLVDTYTVYLTNNAPVGTFTVTNGQNGTNGVGVPAGGTTGQVLAKKSNTDYDTEWVNAGGGGGSGSLYEHTINIFDSSTLNICITIINDSDQQIGSATALYNTLTTQEKAGFAPWSKQASGGAKDGGSLAVRVFYTEYWAIGNPAFICYTSDDQPYVIGEDMSQTGTTMTSSYTFNDVVKQIL